MSERRSTVALATTVALAAFCAFHWANLVVAPPVGKVVLIVAIAAALGLALVMLGRRNLSPARAACVAAALTVLALVAGVLAAGLELRLLAPGHWDELGAALDDGIAGLGGATYPYDEGGRWSYLVLLLVLPVALVVAMALSFWPAAGRTWPRAAGLGVLIAVYGFATVLYAPGLPVLHGLILLALVAACLWAPELRGSRVGLAGAAVALAALVAVPVAAALDRERPVVDYRSWTWTGGEPSVSFAWNHSYGPLDWPREGTPLLEIRSPEPHYWRSIVLERFDGFRWVRSDVASVPMELPNVIEGADGSIRDGWYETTEVTVRELRSVLVVSPGSPQSVGGLQGLIAADGTTLAGELPASGQTYEVRSYAPDPSTKELAASPGTYPLSLQRFTQLELPTSDLELPENLDLPQLEGAGAANLTTEPMSVPLWGLPRTALAAAARRSGYGDVYAIARGLAREASTPYELVRGVEDFLAQGYSYSEEPARSERPLRSFLLQERTGYCQQFSGAMALLLRMNGIPSRVVSGFSPGAPDLDEDGVFIVKDTDAHSWVEVYFSGIGWVPFDPTPGASPANFQSTNSGAAATPGGIADQPGAREREPEFNAGGDASDGAAADDGSPLGGVVLLVLAALAAGIATGAAIRRRRFRALRPQEMLAAQAAELAAAAGVARYRSEPGMTLLQLERRLRAGGRARAASYASRIGESRFGALRARGPDLDERRTVRRDLSRSQGLRVRMRLLGAIPPGAPR